MSETLSVRQALHQHKKIVQPVRGDSMLPMLNEDKDAVELVAVEGRLQKYDLPLYQRPNGRLVLHRIIDVKKNHYLTCGDNRTKVEKVPFDWVIAVATGFYKDGTYVSCQDEKYLSYIQEHWRDFPNRKIVKKIPNEWKLIMSLYRRVITGREEEIQLSNNLSWERFYNFCKEQMVGATVYPALEKVACPAAIRDKFRQLNQQSLHKMLLFKAEREAVYQELEKHKIPYMSLKGILYAPLYPASAMRETADNDILIHPEDAQTVNRCMTDRGYSFRQGWVHGSYHKKPCFNFEFHTKLFYDKTVEAGFQDVWQRAKPVGEDRCEFLMSDEDIYLHTVAHFHKHYSEGGAGLRAFADLYLLRKQNKDYDTQYIDRKLDEMGLREFAAFFEETAAALFDGDMGAIPSETVYYIFGSGAYGNTQNRARNAVKKVGAGRYFWSRVFLPYSNMCLDYPCLRKFPILLPVFWVVRLVRSLFDAQKRRNMKIDLTAMAQNKKNKKK